MKSPQKEPLEDILTRNLLSVKVWLVVLVTSLLVLRHIGETVFSGIIVALITGRELSKLRKSKIGIYKGD